MAKDTKQAKADLEKSKARGILMLEAGELKARAMQAERREAGQLGFGSSLADSLYRKAAILEEQIRELKK